MIALDAPYELHPQVALRPEPFGALAYHYGNRRLVFLRSPEIVAVVRSLGEHPDVAATLSASRVPEQRWPAFRRALHSLVSAEVIRPRCSPTTSSADSTPRSA